MPGLTVEGYAPSAGRSVLLHAFPDGARSLCPATMGMNTRNCLGQVTSASEGGNLGIVNGESWGLVIDAGVRPSVSCGPSRHSRCSKLPPAVQRGLVSGAVLP